jgi:hypothetical protein
MTNALQLLVDFHAVAEFKPTPVGMEVQIVGMLEW